MKPLIILSLLVALGCLCTSGHEQDSLINNARNHISMMRYSDALKSLRVVEQSDSLCPDMLYLKAETYLIFGMPEYQAYFQKLANTDRSDYVDILNLKYLQFIGSKEFDGALEQARIKYPDHPEVQYCQWLRDLQMGAFESCRQKAHGLSSPMLMRFLPYLAMHYHAWDRDHGLALQYLDTLENMVGEYYGSKYRPVLNLLSRQGITPSEKDVMELPFSWCGPGLGFYLLDSKGDSIQIELDTGTGYGLMTVHDLEKGKSIAGEDLLTIENGIQYNYMGKPQDLHYKQVQLSNPDYKDLILGYFNGKFTKADGCASPFVFAGHAMHMDPLNNSVWLRSRDNLENFLRDYPGQADKIPYEVRNGWIFIPCRVNGHEVKMMIETGSRDVNFNPLSVDYLELQPYDGVLAWNGKDYPMKKVDCTLEIGSFRYAVKGGLVSDFVLGNWYYGLGSAGDIGPEFLRNYAFIIDPFHQQFILLN